MERSIAFDRIADRYDADRGGSVRGEGLAGELLARLPEGRVLEIGIGTGSIAGPMRDRGREVVGVDISRAMLQHAHERLGAVVAEGDAQRLPVASASISCVAAVWVLHLVADPAAVLDEVARVLAPRGRFVTITARGHHEEGDEIDAALDAVSPSPPRQDDPDAVIAVAVSAGLELVEHAPTKPLPYRRSPAYEADRMEQRLFSHMFDMDDDTFAREVQPKVDALRALPEPRRGRDRAVHHDLLAFQHRA